MNRDNPIVALGGSGIGSGNDIDLVYIAEKIRPYEINIFKRALEDWLGKRVSVCPMTYMMFENKHLWSGKVATMFYKGVVWLVGEHLDSSVSFDEMRDIRMREAPAELNAYLKKIVEHPEKKDKILELSLQLIGILTEK